jgi:ribosomal protein S18 acetylase RimI-like enzyme
VRLASPADAQLLSALREQFWSDQIVKGTIDHPEMSTLSADTAAMLGRARTSIFVALHQSEVAGYLLGQTRILPGVAGSVVSSVEEIFVLPQYRRSHIARGLVEASLSAFKAGGAKRIQLRVLEQNDSAKKFWRELNFLPSVTIYEYAAEPEKAADTA